MAGATHLINRDTNRCNGIGESEARRGCGSEARQPCWQGRVGAESKTLPDKAVRESNSGPGTRKTAGDGGMEIMKKLLALLALVAMVGLAAPAHCRSAGTQRRRRRGLPGRAATSRHHLSQSGGSHRIRPGGLRVPGQRRSGTGSGPRSEGPQSRFQYGSRIAVRGDFREILLPAPPGPRLIRGWARNRWGRPATGHAIPANST